MHAIISDIHFHNWRQFSNTLPSGVNSRLHTQIAEVRRAAEEAKRRRCERLYFAGDVFHVRGTVTPSVLNPVVDLFKYIIEVLELEVRMIPGNHDLEGKNSERLGSAVTVLERVGTHVVYDATYFSDDNVLMIPWFDNQDALREQIKNVQIKNIYDHSDIDLIVHAPLNGVIKGLPDHGFSVDEVNAWGFKRVFFGHHHNHVNFGDKVFSIGAVGHHNFGDTAAKAGFLLVGDTVEHIESSMPKFVDLDPNYKGDLRELIKGNYIRARAIDSKNSTVEKIREQLQKLGAAGVIINANREANVQREGAVTASISAGASLEQSISNYVASQFKDEVRATSISQRSQRILSEARARV